MTSQTGIEAKELVLDPVQIAAQSLAECDRLTSHPKDRGRAYQAVADEQVAAAPALSACQKAVSLNDAVPRAHFQLGRVYWISGRDEEAFDSFAIAAGGNYAIAMKYVGDAYLERRGLPADAPTDDAELYRMARDWYQKSADAGYEDGVTAVAEADELIRSTIFNPQLFQNPAAIAAMYNGGFLKDEDAVLNAYYAQGLIQQMEHSDQFFMDAECKPLVYKISKTVVDLQVMLSMAGALRSERHAVGAVVGLVAGDYARDMGKKDAINLMNIYKCKSPITKRIVDNILLTNSSAIG